MKHPPYEPPKNEQVHVPREFRWALKMILDDIRFIRWDDNY
jgi:hypothetical protein